MLLALEGPKGVGKTTVVRGLRERLGETDRRVVLTKEPTDKFDLAQEGHLSGAELARAIAADRANHVVDVITPALAAGNIVICDRYILSSLVFHSIDEVDPEEIWRLNETFPPPNINLVLTASAAIICSRRGTRQTKTRLESMSTPTAEQNEYIRFGKVMQISGSKLQVLPNETPEQLTGVLTWIMRTINRSTLS